MLKKLMYWKFCIIATIAAKFNMVHVPVDVIQDCMMIQSYFEWLDKNMECEGPTKEELLYAKETHANLLRFLQAGKTFTI